jgi:hypothetical protein
MERKKFDSNHALRRKPQILGLHPTVALLVAIVGTIIIIVFSAFEWSPELGWFIFIAFTITIQASAPKGLGDLIARMIPPANVTRGHTLYESPLNLNARTKRKKTTKN